MSWQSYVDDQICTQIQCRTVCIAGLADGQIWAKFEKTPEDAIQEKEMKSISEVLRAGQQASFFEKGIYIANQKFVCLSAEPKLVRGRKGSSALCIVVTNTCILLAATMDGFPPGQLNNVVERLGEYLVANNY